MRIERLHMENFAPFPVALGKTEVTLDYRPHLSKVINIFIGQMGSCKTFLLAHHQPFATLGNLDVRNSEDMIIEGERGLKEIDFRDGDNLFEITHIYTPSKNSHTVKSYVRKNGIELNPNGNSSSFREIILTEFGLDQNFLKLFRIGSNVVNLPDMSSTERKSFISSMIADTEVYTMLYRKIGEENRAINAQMTLLINRLHQISSHTEEELIADRDTEQAIVTDITGEVENLTAQSYQLDALIRAKRDGMSPEEYEQLHQSLLAQSKQCEEDLKETQKDLDKTKSGDSEDVKRKLITLTAQIGMRSKQIMSVQMRLDETEQTRDKLKDQLSVMASPAHIENLRKTYEQLMTTLASYERQLKNFSYTGSMGSVLALQNEAQNIDRMITDVSQYNADAVKELFRNRTGSLNRAKRRLAALYRKKEQNQAEMGNHAFIAKYTPTHPMFRPFSCPTEDCPYFKYHPITLQKGLNPAAEKAFLEKRSENSKLDTEIYLLEDYPNIARRIELLQSEWHRVSPRIKELGCLIEEYLPDIVTNLMHRQWCDLKRMGQIRELCGIREKYYELMQEVASMRNELTQYEITDVEKLQQDLAQAEASYQALCNEIADLEKANQQANAELEELNDLLIKLAAREDLIQRERHLIDTNESLHAELAKMKANLADIADLEAQFSDVKMKLTERKTEYRAHFSSLEKLSRKITDIQLTKDQYEDTLKRQEMYHDILDAVSSKKGIPLAYVRVFLSDCKDIINDLISDVFDDDIEIVDFDIPEDSNEFKIPYRRNGALIDDIVKSSQGERAIISLALSFALIRQRTFPYNIMLLDEVDGPLHYSARNKFITILFKQLRAIMADQVFLVSHNNTFDGYNVNIIMTTDERVDETASTSVMTV